MMAEEDLLIRNIQDHINFIQTEYVKFPSPVLMLGASSFVGSRVQEAAGALSEVYVGGRSEDLSRTAYTRGRYPVDITDPETIKRAVDAFPGKYVINFAADTTVDAIEKSRPADPSRFKENWAYKVNALGPANLAKACKSAGKVLIHTSTDFVYDGTKGSAYTEDDPTVESPDKVNWYGFTKAEGERLIKKSGAKFLIIRIGFPYGHPSEIKEDFIVKFLSEYDKFTRGEKDKMMPRFADQRFTPTYKEDLAKVLNFLIRKEITGIIHVASPEEGNLHQILCYALRVARGIKNPETVVPEGSLAKYMSQNPAYMRPLVGSLDTSKLQGLGYDGLTSWRDGIKKSYPSKLAPAA